MQTKHLLFRCWFYWYLLISYGDVVQGYISHFNALRTSQRPSFSFPTEVNLRSFRLSNEAEKLVSLESYNANKGEEVATRKVDPVVTPLSSPSSKRALLSFAVPALGIYLTNPLLSNMDNAFVGKTVGVTGLAALSPATLCIDQMLYLFGFLSRATTGLVARAYGQEGNTTAARDVASART
jgi:hypothetical protein